MARVAKIISLLGTHGGASSSTFSNGSSIGVAQVAYGDAAGKLTSGAGLLYASSVLTLGDNASSPELKITGAAGVNRFVRFQTSGGNRWTLGAESTAESGGNAGSALQIRAHDDSGTLIDTPVTINRPAGGTIAIVRPVTSSYASDPTALIPAWVATATATIAGGVTDAYNASVRLTPTYSAATALTVTRHNYIDVNQPTLSGAGPAALTDAAVFRFNAAIGTHKAIDSGSTKTSPGTVTAWMKVNLNSTIHYIPCYSSKTS